AGGSTGWRTRHVLSIRQELASMDWRRGVRHDGVDVGPRMVLAWQSERFRLRRAARHHAARSSSTTRTDGASRPRAHHRWRNHFDCLRALLPAVSDYDNVVCETTLISH